MSNYLYNGVDLPDINEVWTDKGEFPFAHLTKLGSVIELWLVDQPFMVTYKAEEIVGMYVENGISFEHYRKHWETGKWFLYDSGTYENSAGGYTDDPFWTSVDMLRVNRIPDTSPIEYEKTETIGLAASDPVPVSVPTPDPLSLVKGYRVGCAIRANR